MPAPPARPGAEMTLWQAASAIFFAYIACAALVAPRLPRRRKLQSAAAAGAALLFIYVNAAMPHPLLDTWIAPPVVLLLAYWTSGLLFVAPMARVEAALFDVDRRLQLRKICRWTPRPLAEVLEVAYAAVYIVIPIALIVHLEAVERPNAAAFWSVILITDYICFGTLPWIQTRPPRALEHGEPWTAGFRVCNLHLLGKTSIQANTFPSGHAAEAVAAALVVIGAPAPVVAAMFVAALSISAGSVLGRYHYATDIVAGWAVAVTVYVLVMVATR